MRLCLTTALLCALTVPAAARPFTVEDDLHLEAVGAASIDPSGRNALLELQGPLDQAPRFDDDVNTRPTQAHLFRIDLDHPTAAAPAFPQNPKAGYIAGPFSPSGRRVAILRDLNRHWELGVLTLASRRVRWLGFGVEFADWGDTLAWRSDDHLIALAMPPGDRYYKQRLTESAMLELPGLWRRAVLGKSASAVAIGSGRYLGVRIADAPRSVVDVDLASGRRRTLATGVFQSLALSADGRTAALIALDGRAPLKADQLISVATQYRQNQLQLLDLDRGTLTTPCPGKEALTSSLRWSPSGAALLAYVRSPGADWSLGDYRRIDPGGACTALPLGGLKPSITVDVDAGGTSAHIDWLGDEPMVLAAPKAGGRLNWFALASGRLTNLTADLRDAPSDPIGVIEEHALFLDYRGRPWSFNDHGRGQLLTETSLQRVLPPRRTDMTVPAPKDGASRTAPLLALASEAGQTQVWSITAASARRIASAAGEPPVVLAASPHGVLINQIDPHGVGVISVVRDGAAAALVARVNTQLEAVDFAPAQEIDHSGPHSELLKSWLYLPPHSAPSVSKPPLLIMAYPSAVFPTPSSFGQPGLRIPIDENVQLAAAHGYAVLVPSLPHDPDSTDPAAGWNAQLTALVDRVSAMGAVDIDHVAYWGHSFGGYVGLVLATETDRFKAIIASAPISDLISFRTQGWPAAWLTSESVEAVQGWAGWSELGGQGHILGTPWTARQKFIDNSPVFAADRIRTPIMLVQGDQDAVSIAQSREMFGDLDRLNKDVLFLTFYGEHHNIVSPYNVRAFSDAAYRFLDTYLKP